jgi:hypothetical protein
MQKNIYNTVLWLNQRDFAPTLLDIEKWLVGSKALNSSEIAQAVEADNRLSMIDGVITLVGREELARVRREKYDHTETKWKRVKPFLRLISWMPGVQAIWLCNAMGWGNARHESDIDVAIVARRGRIWTARFFTALAMKLLRQRPGEIDQSKAICLSFYMTEDALNLSSYQLDDHDMAFAFWAANMYPVWDPQNIFSHYRAANTWLSQHFADLQWTQSNPKRQFSHSFPERVLKIAISWIAPERLLKRWQRKHLPQDIKRIANEDNRVVLSDTILKLHTNDNRAEQNSDWLNYIQR